MLERLWIFLSILSEEFVNTSKDIAEGLDHSFCSNSSHMFGDVENLTFLHTAKQQQPHSSSRPKVFFLRSQICMPHSAVNWPYSDAIILKIITYCITILARVKRQGGPSILCPHSSKKTSNFSHITGKKK